MSEKTIMPRTELEEKILELYEMLTEQQKMAIVLVAAINAACNEEGHR